MIKFIYKDGANSVKPAVLPIGQSSMFQTLESAIGKCAEGLICKTHKGASSATIILNVGPAQYQWEFADFCCFDFSRQIASAIPKPWCYAEKTPQPLRN